MMKERQRWRCEEDALVRSYVRQYGPREWHLISDRMNAPSFNRDAKSCLERWKNYLKPGIKKGSLTEEEQLLVVRLQAKHGNKWKKIAAQVPGRTAKRLGKWWEVFKEKQQRERERESSSCSNSNSNSNDLQQLQQRMRRRSRINASAIEPSKYDRILESFAEKLVGHQSVLPMPIIMPPMHWLKNWGTSTSTSTLPAVPPVNVPEIGVCFGELEEGFRAWGEQRKEAAWRVKRVELQLESEKASRAREKVEEVEVTVRALREEEALALERIDEEYNQQVAALRRDAEAKEQKLVEQWGAKHARMRMLVHHQHQHQLTAAASSSCYQQQISQGCCSNSNSNSGGPCVDLTLSSPPVAAAAATTTTTPPLLASEIGECYRELHQGFQAWGEERKEVVWRLKRVELQLEAEKASRRREKVEEVEAKIRAVRDDEALVLERIDADYKEQAVALRRDAEAKENRLAEQWAAKHARMGRLVEQLGCHQWVPAAAAAAAAEEMNGQRRSI